MGNMHVKRGDTVYILNGKDAGKKGKVMSVDSDDKRVVVEGINIVTKHMKPRPNKGYQSGGLVHQEAAIHVSKVMVVCDKCGNPSKTGKKLLDEGKKARVCKRCGEIIDVIGESN